MKYISIAIGILLGIATCNASAEQDPEQRSPTAEALSCVTIGAIKMAALNDKSSKPSMRSCIAQLDDHSLAELFEKSLRENMSTDELRYLDSFYATPLANKYNLYTLQEGLTKNGGSLSVAPVTLTRDEIAQHSVFAQSDAGKKLASIASLSDKGAMAAIKPALVGLIRGCQGGS